MPEQLSPNLHLDSAVIAMVEQLASARQQTPDAIVREAVEEFALREQKREQLRGDLQLAWDEYQQDGLHLTAEETDDWLGKLQAGEDAPVPPCHV